MLDHLMYWILDELLDDLWAGITRRELVQTAGTVGFNLAFIIEFESIDDQPTMRSKRGLGRWML